MAEFTRWKSGAPGRDGGFDIHILSDSMIPTAGYRKKRPGTACAWIWPLTDIFYRRRRINLKRKSGNVADFCPLRAHYTYMIVFDADSVMTGET